MRSYIGVLMLVLMFFLPAPFASPGAQTIPTTLKIGEVFSTAVAGRAELTLDFTDRDYELILYTLQTSADTTKTFAYTVSPPAASKIVFTRTLRVMPPDDRDRFEGELRVEERRLSERLRRIRLASPKPAPAQTPVIGSTRTFAFRKFGGVAQDVTVTARLAAMSSKALAYVDQELTGPTRKVVTTTQIQALLDEFDRTTYPLVTSVFGRESDVDGDGRIMFLFTPRVNQVGGIAGFYSAASVVPKNQGGNGNMNDLMYLSPDREPNYYRSLLAHEFQHLVNFNQHVLVRSGGDAEDSWLNEGLSHVTEDMVGDHAAGGNTGLVETFLAHPERFSLTGEALLNLGVRGAAYLFVRGLTDQKGQAVLGSLTQTGKAGPINVEEVTGLPFADLYRGWAARLFLSGTKLNEAQELNYTFANLTETTTGRRAIPIPREDALTAGGTPLSGVLRQTGLTFIRLTGSGSSRKVAISVDHAGDVQAMVIPVPKSFRPQLVAPVDFFESIKLDDPLSSSQVAGAPFTVSGTVTESGISKIMLRFTRTDAPDSIKLVADVTGGRFSRPVVFAPSQAGTWVLTPFVLREGPLYDGINAFGPLAVEKAVGEATLPVDWFSGLRFDQPVSVNRIAGTGFTLAGGVTDPAIQEVLLRFIRRDRPDTLKFYAGITAGRFRRPVLFTPSQAGTYRFEVFGRRSGPLFDSIDEYPEFVVSKGLTDDVLLPADYFQGITFDAPFSATITAGLPIRISGILTDLTGNLMLVNFAPSQGDDIQFELNVVNGRFGQDIVFAPEQAGAYKLNFYLGQRGSSSFPYLDGFDPVSVKAVPGIKTLIPNSYFAGLILDTPFAGDQFVGKAARFSGSVTSASTTQLAVDFIALDGGRDLPTAVLNVTGGRFSQDFSFTRAGTFSMKVYAGVRGQSLPYAGQFEGVRVRTGQPDLTIGAPRLEFGEVPTGGSKEQTLRLYNRGTQALTIRDIIASPSALSATPRATAIAPGDSARVTVIFRPTAAGDLLGTITVLSDDPDEGVLSVSVIGRSVAVTLQPLLVLSSPSLAFDSVRVGNVSRQALSISNTGNDTLRVAGLRVTGIDSAHYSISIAPFIVAPGGSQALTVTFAPGSGGSKTATLIFTHNGSEGSSSIPLTGLGVASPSTAKVGDFSGDGKVDFDDFFLFATVFGTERGKPGYEATYDLDGSGSVDFSDFFIFATAFGS